MATCVRSHALCCVQSHLPGLIPQSHLLQTTNQEMGEARHDGWKNGILLSTGGRHPDLEPRGVMWPVHCANISSCIHVQQGCAHLCIHGKSSVISQPQLTNKAKEWQTVQMENTPPEAQPETLYLSYVPDKASVGSNSSCWNDHVTAVHFPVA